MNFWTSSGPWQTTKLRRPWQNGTSPGSRTGLNARQCRRIERKGKNVPSLNCMQEQVLGLGSQRAILARSLALGKLLARLLAEQQQLLPGAEGGDADLLQLLVRQGDEGGQVDLVAHEGVGVPGVQGGALHYCNCDAPPLGLGQLL